LTLNHPSLIYQEEKKKWAMARVREEEEQNRVMKDIIIQILIIFINSELVIE
jgi:hypothetical protein